MSRRSHRACRLSIFVDETDQWQHRPLFHEIVHRAKAAGLAGATAFRGIEGFGTHQLIHTTRLLTLSLDMPILIVIIDEEQRIRDFLPQLDEVIGEGLATLEDIEVILYGHRPVETDQ